VSQYSKKYEMVVDQVIKDTSGHQQTLSFLRDLRTRVQSLSQQSAIPAPALSPLSKDEQDIIKSINSQSAGGNGKDAEMENERERQQAAIRCAFVFDFFLHPHARIMSLFLMNIDQLLASVICAMLRCAFKPCLSSRSFLLCRSPTPRC